MFGEFWRRTNLLRTRDQWAYDKTVWAAFLGGLACAAPVAVVAAVLVERF